MIAHKDWKWYGRAGHFICANKCQFHMCTAIGDVLVSTVGEHFPADGVREIYAQKRGVKLEGRGDAREADYMNKVGYEQIGYGRKYETMVFRLTGEVCTVPECNCGMPSIVPSEIDFEGYNLAGLATTGHMAMCVKWAAQS